MANSYVKIFKYPECCDLIYDIKFSDIPLKIKNNHFIEMFYKSKPLFIQLPISEIKTTLNEGAFNEDSLIRRQGTFNEDVIRRQGTLCIKISDQVFNQNFINPLEEHIKKIVHLNSEKWFNKTFTMHKIDSCLISKFNK
jgi:hypothetical protein